MATPDDFQRLQAFFSTPVALRASKSLSSSAVIELKVDKKESYYFQRLGSENVIRQASGDSPDITFIMTPKALERILQEKDSDIGSIGVAIARLIFSQDTSEKVWIKLHAGVLSLMTKGYFGVLTSGGKELTSFLATQGFNGIGAIQAAIKKLRK